MGVVYQAWDDELSTAVALKVIRSDPDDDPRAEQERQRRFKQELVLARQVTHKHVIRIHDLGDIDGIRYFTMPCVQGESLASMLRREGHLPVERALALARQIVAGLAAAHEAGIVHRDLKPANIMIDGNDQALILDFGIARTVSGRTIGTASGVLVGTIDYMAPEQATGSHVDQRADVYAFGLMLAEMLVGRHSAGTADGTLATLMERARQAPAPVRSIDRSIPEALDRVVTRCLQPDPAARYQTSSELAAELDRLDADGHPRVEAAPRWRPWAVPALGALCVVLAGTGVWFYIKGRTPPAAPAERPPVSVLIADFDNKSGDQVFDNALEQALGIAVEGASFVSAYRHAAAEGVLARMAPGRPLDEVGARLVAQREGVSVVLAGSIARAGTSYDIQVKVIEPANDKPRILLKESARDKADVLAAVGSLGGQVRRALGDTATDSALQAGAETFTASSLEAMRAYSLGQDAAYKRTDEEAITYYREAIQHDAQFGRAWAGLAISTYTLGRTDETREAASKALALLDRMTEREKYRTLCGYYLMTDDYEKGVEGCQTLTRLYPADTAGHSNLAMGYFFLLNFPGALREGRRAVELQPTSDRFTTNYALYAMYGGDFATAAEQARANIKRAPGSYIAYLPLAIAEAAAGRLDAAREIYGKMAATDSTGASIAATGLADLALYQGDAAAARGILERGIAEDATNKNTRGLIAKHVAMAEAWAMDGRTQDALTEARKAVAFGRERFSLLSAARMVLAAGKNADAEGFAAELQKQVPAVTRAYGKIIEGETALARQRTVEAIDAFQAARKLADVWQVRYDLGVAYVQAGLYAQAISELEACEKRRGEAAALFLDDIPTFRYLAPLPYWLGRANEGLGMKEAAAGHYRKFLALRPAGLHDPLADDARKRTGER